MIESLKHGEQARLARKIGITPRHMNDIIRQRKKPSRALSEKLDAVTGICAEAWLFPHKHPNPLLKGGNNGTARKDKDPGPAP
jgi:plasmid maintenance system antidote protein VapI